MLRHRPVSSSNAAVTSQHCGIQAGGIRSRSAQHQAGQPACLEFCLADRGSMYAPLRDPCSAFWEIMSECSEGPGGGWATRSEQPKVFCHVLKDPGFLIPPPRPAASIGVFGGSLLSDRPPSCSCPALGSKSPYAYVDRLVCVGSFVSSCPRSEVGPSQIEFQRKRGIERRFMLLTPEKNVWLNGQHGPATLVQVEVSQQVMCSCVHGAQKISPNELGIHTLQGPHGKLHSRHCPRGRRCTISSWRPNKDLEIHRRE
ncbi:hypothetical protein EYF80_001940 [Liparis tanakae]|uniref:Uncharacterized protein n=1 Tax=Liparis tanakae TaxID=230148 RepID=A0A4Z2JCN2_9TELE|nr:hypothetical protein EYF80_001940 [Liparis tanakae]